MNRSRLDNTPFSVMLIDFNEDNSTELSQFFDKNNFEFKFLKKDEILQSKKN